MANRAFVSARKRALRVMVACTWLIVGALSGCEGDSPTVSDSNTNWLLACRDNRDCQGGLRCLCGICTEACAVDNECTAAGEGARCVSTEVGVAADRCTGRGYDDVARICAVTCETTNTCSAPEQACVQNLCEEPLMSLSDAASVADAELDAMSTDASLLDSGALDADVIDASTRDADVIDASALDGGTSDSALDGSTVACAPGPCVNDGRCSLDGMRCECPVGIGGATCDQIATVRQLVVGLHHSCVLLGSNAVKCWGDNEAGQLGQGDTSPRGDAPNELGASLPAIDLGTSVPIDSISAGTAHTCALFVDGTIKCWGLNADGVLGLGDNDSRGDAPGEMGTALPFVPLGGLAARQVSAGDTHTCARFEDGRVACWGGNLNGQLGIDSVLSRGAAPDELGVNLQLAQLGAGAQAKQVVASAGYSCALLEGDTVKCWGRNVNGQLGQGDTDNRGDAVGEMAMLSAIALGDVSSGISAIDAHGSHACALLGDGALRCWGFGGAGQLEQGDTATLGDQPNEMGINLANARIGGVASQVSAGTAQTCAVLTGNVLKCWGQNNAGQLGPGDVPTRGDELTEVDAMLPSVMLPAGTVTQVATGGFHTCVLLDGASVYCFGENTFGQLGRGTMDRVGDELTEIPIGPPAVAF